MKDKQPTRKIFLDAVFKLVYTNGYNGTSMAMILQECGMPKGSLYYYFKFKKEMVLAVIEKKIAPSMDEFDAIDTIITTMLRISNKNVIILCISPYVIILNLLVGE